MDAIILFSHGSVLCGAGESLLAHAQRLQQQVNSRVTVGYLNYSQPTFQESVRAAAAEGATRFLILPYFLIPGYFVKVDLPKAIAASQQEFPEAEFLAGEPLGFDSRLADALIKSAQEAQEASDWRQDLQSAPQYCRPHDQCPLYETALCPRRPGVKLLPEGLVNSGNDLPPTNQSNQSSFTERDRALLVMVHGSPRPIANSEMFRVVEELRARSLFPTVEVGFMECNEPTIPDAIDSCVNKGAKEIIAVPYFLHTGTHVADDLPTLLEAGQVRHPEIHFRMGDYLGRSPLLTDILSDRLKTLLTSSPRD